MSVDSRPRKRAAPYAESEGARVPARGRTRCSRRLIDRCAPGLPPARLAGRAAAARRLRDARLPGRGPAAVGSAATRAIMSRHLEEHFGRTDAVAGRAAREPIRRCCAHSGFSARKGETLQGARRAVRRRAPERRGARRHMTDDEVEADPDRGARESGRGRRAGSCSWPSTGPTCSSPATSRFGARSNGRTVSTTFRPKTRCSKLSDRWRPYRSLAVSYLFASEYDGGI